MIGVKTPAPLQHSGGTLVSYRVLVTDYDWPNLDVEQSILAGVGAELMIPNFRDEDELVGLAPQADAILVNWCPRTGRIIRAATACKVVVRYGVGVDNIDIVAATENGIVVANVPDYCMDEVSNHAMAFLLAATRRLHLYDRSVKSHTWTVKVGMPYPRLQGCTLGIIGFGRIGKTVAPKALAFGLRVLVYDPYINQKDITDRGCVPASFETLLTEADFVTLHVPLTPETTGIVNDKALRLMKPTAWLINTARGRVVDVKALTVALKEGRLAGAGLDVLPVEPPDWNDELFTLPNVLNTPHSAFYSEGSLQELREKSATRVAECLQGRVPSTIVNSEVLKQANLRMKVRS
jgi:D-3-phosphoglycerate dehydrogenase / 2-oxoglutarate reductase